MIPTRAFGILSSGLATKFTTPNDESFIEETSLFEILKKPCNWFISIPSMLIMVILKITVCIPIIIVMSTT